LRMRKLTKDEIAKLKIVDGEWVSQNTYFLIIEAPSNMNYRFDTEKRDRRYLAGLFFTYPKDVQKMMWQYVIKNFILPRERKRWIEEITEWLKQSEFGDSVLEVEQ